MGSKALKDSYVASYIARYAVCACIYTVKTLGLLQPYFGHLSCMIVAYVTRYKLQGMLPICFKVYLRSFSILLD